MEKIKEFFKTNIIVMKWALCYFIGLWCVLYFLFGFNLLSNQHWNKFFHATGFHGFGGFAFQVILYASLPIFIATTVSIYRSKEPIITIPLFDKIKEIIINKIKPAPIEEPTEEVKEDTENESENIYPEDLPHELRVPFTRAKNRLPITSQISVYNKTNTNSESETQEPQQEADTPFPIPSDFDISDDISEINTMPSFHDIDFDTPIMTEKKLENTTTKYFDNKKIKYETYKNFIATDAYLIYEHNDGDFWIMDEDSWFASGKQIDSPVPELLQTAKQNNLIPIIYLESQNIMDIENTISTFEDKGIRVIKDIKELF